jgi:hypothetical protein
MTLTIIFEIFFFLGTVAVPMTAFVIEDVVRRS